MQVKELLFMALYLVCPCSCVYGIATIHIKLLSRRDPWRLNFLLIFSTLPTSYMRSRLRGAARIMSSTLRRSSAASLADDTTAFFNL